MLTMMTLIGDNGETATCGDRTQTRLNITIDFWQEFFAGKIKANEQTKGKVSFLFRTIRKVNISQLFHERALDMKYLYKSTSVLSLMLFSD